jgi:hypothetical protein
MFLQWSGEIAEQLRGSLYQFFSRRENKKDGVFCFFTLTTNYCGWYLHPASESIHVNSQDDLAILHVPSNDLQAGSVTAHTPWKFSFA